MNRFELLKTLRRHRILSEKRSLIWEQNRTAKVFIWIGIAFTLLYLIMFAVMFAMIANKSKTITACELMYGISPFILLIDFALRFMTQRTPSQLIKPYTLLAIPKYACIDTFLLTSLMNGGNLTWFAMLVPYAIMSVIFSEGIIVTLGFLLGFYILILINSQWYMLVRTLINDKIYWWALPVFIYAIALSPWYIGANAGISQLSDTYAQLGNALSHWSPIAFASVILLLLLLLIINRRVQYHYIWSELASINQTKLKHVSEFRSLDRLGEIGEYIKLEIKSIFRNKNVRKAFIFANLIVIILSLVISFTNAYEGKMIVFWIIYNFAIYGIMTLSRVMCYEGNYIDCLMIHHENILSLLRAKYYFTALLLIFPTVLMTPMLITGKCSPLMLVSILFFTAGPIFCLLLQTAVYNKQSIPLNAKFIGRGSMENSTLQVVVNIIAFLIPFILINVLRLFFSQTVTEIIILALGFLFVATHRLWLQNIYKRLMTRRYENMAGFRSSAKK